jgi:hypothetical protein
MTSTIKKSRSYKQILAVDDEPKTSNYWKLNWVLKGILSKQPPVVKKPWIKSKQSSPI